MFALLHKVNYPRGLLATVSSSMTSPINQRTSPCEADSELSREEQEKPGIGVIRTATMTKAKATKIQWTVLISIADVTERARGLPTRFSPRMSPDCLVIGGHCRIDLPRFRRIPERSPFSRPARTV